jgi:hypothetical protein
MEEVALQNLAKTHVDLSSHLELVGRAFLQIFITTTLHHRLPACVARSFVQLLRIYRQVVTI